jgi:hypothetical protein
LQPVYEFLEFMFDTNCVIIVIVIVATIVGMTTTTGSAETWVARDGDGTDYPVCTVDADIMTLMGEPDMFYCRST